MNTTTILTQGGVLPVEDVIDRAVARATVLAALLRTALSATCALARADLVAMFEGLNAELYERMDAAWFGAETQAAMCTPMARLAERKQACQ